MSRSLTKWTALVLTAVAIIWAGYDFVVRDDGVGYFASKSSGFWLALTGGVLLISIVSLILWKAFGDIIPVFLWPLAACILSLVTVRVAAALIRATNSPDLPLGPKEILTISGILVLSALMTIACWVAAGRARKRCQKGSKDPIQPATKGTE